MSEKVKNNANNTLAQMCYEQINNEIVNGNRKPGEKLKIDLLKNHLNVGQSPIREALSRLAAHGLVEIENNKGFRVAHISEDQIRDTYAIFTLVEKTALSLAIEKGDASWQARIVGELYKLGLLEHEKKPVPYNVWAEQNGNFHVALISGCNSPLLLDIRKNLYLKFDRYCRIAYQTCQDTLSTNHEEHKKLAAAVLEKDTKKALTLITHHINDPLEHIIQILKNNKLI